MKLKMMVLAAVLLSLGCTAAIKLDPVFSSNMMMQQEAPIAFFGTATPKADILAEFAGQKQTAQVKDDGQWRIVFPPMKAGKTIYEAKISEGESQVTLSNLIIGDVWVCAGQSNMEMPIGATFRRGWSAQNCEQEVAAANYPEIRYVDQQNRISHNVPLKQAKVNNGGWVPCSPAVAANFSATAYFFARQLHKDLDIPIGLINLTWSGTAIQPWISLQGYENAKLESDLAQIRRFQMTAEQKRDYEAAENARLEKELAAYQTVLEAATATQKQACAGFAAADLNDSDWKPAVVTNNWQTVVRWYRANVKLNDQFVGKDVTLAIAGRPGVAIDVFLNGERVGGYAMGSKLAEKNVRIALKAAQLKPVNTLAVRSTFIFDWTDRANMDMLLRRTTLTTGDATQSVAGWKQKDEVLFDWRAAKAQRPNNINVPYYGPQFQCNLYNGMVEAWKTLPIKGVIWYQGCSNNGQLHYYPLHKALIADWRAQWKQPDMPFMIVQLAGFGDAEWEKREPVDAPYALTRDIQAALTVDPKVGLACAVDIGEPTNIHPANKQEVGRRLALEAERIAYNKNIVSRGPWFDKATVEGSSIRVSYRYADKGLKTTDGQAPRCFAIAGEDKKFVWANAAIDGTTVVVSSPAVTAPKYVRYAYAAYRGDCNLQNAEGLAAYPFRSDAVDYEAVK